MNNMKRKTPGSASPAPGPGTPQVKLEQNEDVKKRRIASQLSSSNNVVSGAMDPRTAVVQLRQILKSTLTMNYELAWYHVEQFNPALNITQVLEDFKNVERVTFNAQNSVFTFIPDLVLPNVESLKTHIRNNTTPDTGLSVKLLREALPDKSVSTLEQLEETGDIIIIRGLNTEAWRSCGLPPLGKASKYNGLKINESGSTGGGAASRMKSVWWDFVKERGRAGKRVEDEFIFAWDDVRIEENDDVAKLLRDQELSASSAPPPAPKVQVGPAKKKRQNRRAIKITNTHMLDQGIDLSKDYEAPA